MMVPAGAANVASAHRLVPSVPPPPIPSPLRHKQRLRRQQPLPTNNLNLRPPQKPASSSSGPRRLGKSVSRYRSLRGKSVSSVRRHKPTFDVFLDAEEAVPLPETPSPALQRRSKSAVVSPDPQRYDEENNALTTTPAAAGLGGDLQKSVPPLPTTTIGTPLSSKSGNIPPQHTSSSLTLKAKLENTRPADLARLKQLSKFSSRENISPTKLALRPKGHPAFKEDEAEQWAEEVARLEAETDRILAEQKKRDLARLQAQLAATTTTTKPKPKRLILDKLTFLTKTSKSNASSPSTPTRTSPRTFPLVWSPGTTNFDGSVSPDTMAFVEYGAAGGLVPQIDAPHSASNGGERRVTVRYESSTINLPITAETSPVDIIYSTANLITQKVIPANCILVECYVMFGLERRLRKYERIRDAMNSWDRDQQNTLLILPHDSPPDCRDLELSYVPRTEDPPTGFSFQLYHASRPGKWNKRWITLMDTGQIFAAKRPDTKITDKDGTTLCHLSDFDIYTPKEGEMRRYLKPPKKFCYAIKSQQKTNVFPNGENFVHFFSTEDSKLAHRFHELVHGWRSWYLANKKVDLQDRGKQSLSTVRSSEDATKKSMSSSKRSHHVSPSGDEKPYTIGEFKPLIDMDRFDKPIEEFGKDLPVPQPPPAEVEKKKKEIDAKPRLLAKVQTKPPSVPTSPQNNEGEFLSGGLLGDAYDKRKQAETIVTDVKKIEGPFTEGPSLLNKMAKSANATPDKPDSQSWFPSAVEHTARSRTPPPRAAPSIRRPMTADNASRQKHQQPLLAPGSGHLRPPPPSTRANLRPENGRGVKAPPNGAPLINLANGNPMPSGPAPSRSTSKASASSGGNRLVNQPRRRATTASSRSGGGQSYVSADRPPIPPVPARSLRRPDQRVVSTPTTQSRDRRPQAQEPLINRVR